MKWLFSLIIFIIIISSCGCILDASVENTPPEIESYFPESPIIYTAPYESVSFSIISFDAEGDKTNVSWYIDDKLVSTGEIFHYSFANEGIQELKACVDDGNEMSSISWQIESSISVDAIMDSVEEMRSLSFQQEIPLIEMTKEDVEKEILSEIDMQRAQNELNQKIFAAFGVWDNNLDLQDELVSLYTDAIGGFYDYDKKYFVVVQEDTQNAALKEKTMAHELIHVLQDQTYGIKNIFDLSSNDDMLYACQALVEGDASFFETQYLSSMNADKIKDLYSYILSMDVSDTNELLYSIVITPYIDGEIFIRHVVNTYGVDYLDTLYESLPQSTEQILHPEKYFSNELPQYVEIQGPGEKWTLLDENVLGEMMLNIILAQETSSSNASIASEGWGGDRYGFYTQGEEYALIYKSQWDSATDCNEFFSIYSEIISSRDDVLLLESSSTYMMWDADSKYIKISKLNNCALLQITSSLAALQ